jgi:hypothetical protein
MPVHDWSRVSAGVFHDFHNTWIVELKNALNGGVLPCGYYAMRSISVLSPHLLLRSQTA